MIENCVLMLEINDWKWGSLPLFMLGLHEPEKARESKESLKMSLHKPLQLLNC